MFTPLLIHSDASADTLSLIVSYKSIGDFIEESFKCIAALLPTSKIELPTFWLKYDVNIPNKLWMPLIGFDETTYILKILNNICEAVS